VVCNITHPIILLLGREGFIGRESKNSIRLTMYFSLNPGVL